MLENNAAVNEAKLREDAKRKHRRLRDIQRPARALVSEKLKNELK